jgi:hypothetical protein
VQQAKFWKSEILGRIHAGVGFSVFRVANSPGGGGRESENLSRNRLAVRFFDDRRFQFFRFSDFLEGVCRVGPGCGGGRDFPGPKKPESAGPAPNRPRVAVCARLPENFGDVMDE